MRRYLLLFLILPLLAPLFAKASASAEATADKTAEKSAGKPDQDVTAAQRPRVNVSTDIGGTDPDDLQSMVHFLLYADMFDVEALVSSPYGPGRREHILQVIDQYERDYANLKI